MITGDPVNAARLATDAASAAVAAAQPAAEGGTRRYGVVVGGQRLLLAADGAVRVLEPPPVYRMPNTRAWFPGLANVRGSLVPVYDLAAWLDLPVPETRRMLLVVGQGDASAGVLVDSSPRHLVIAADAPRQAAPAVPAALAEHALETYNLGDAAWTAIDWDALFGQLQRLALAT